MSRKQINRFRGLCAAVAVVACLVYLDTSMMDSSIETSLHTLGTLNTSVSRVLAERRGAATTDAVIEYVSLVVVVLGVGGALGASRVADALVDRRAGTSLGVRRQPTFAVHTARAGWDDGERSAAGRS